MMGALYAACGTLFTFLMTSLGAALVFCFRRSVGERAQRACLGFAAGVMSAASVFSLLCPAAEQAAQRGGIPKVGKPPRCAGLRARLARRSGHVAMCVFFSESGIHSFHNATREFLIPPCSIMLTPEGVILFIRGSRYIADSIA